MASTLSYEYDSAGRAIAEIVSYPDGTTLVSGTTRRVDTKVDANGNMVELSYPAVEGIIRKMNFGYDGFSRLTSINHGPIGAGGDALINYSYDRLSRRSRSVRTEQRAANEQTSFIPDVLNSYLNYGADLLVDSIRDEHLINATAAPRSIVQKFTHSPAGQLLQYRAEDGAGVGQSVFLPTPAPDELGTLTYTANGLNQLTSRGVVNYLYDANGNMIFDGQKVYIYDAENRLLLVGPALFGADDQPVSDGAGGVQLDAGGDQIARYHYGPADPRLIKEDYANGLPSAGGSGDAIRTDYSYLGQEPIMDLAIGSNGQARWVDSQLYINGAGVDERLYVGRGAERSAAEDKPTSLAGSSINASSLFIRPRRCIAAQAPRWAIAEGS